MEKTETYVEDRVEQKRDDETDKESSLKLWQKILIALGVIILLCFIVGFAYWMSSGQESIKPNLTSLSKTPTPDCISPLTTAEYRQILFNRNMTLETCSVKDLLNYYLTNATAIYGSGRASNSKNICTIDSNGLPTNLAELFVRRMPNPPCDQNELLQAVSSAVEEITRSGAREFIVQQQNLDITTLYGNHESIFEKEIPIFLKSVATFLKRSPTSS